MPTTVRQRRSDHVHATEHTPAPRHLRAVETPQTSLDGGIQHNPIPPPERALQRLALYLFEVVEGFRPLDQLGRMISIEALDTVRMQRSARVERRTLLGDNRRVVPTPSSAHISVPCIGVVESVVVLLASPRSTAVAMRLEFARARWQATNVAVL